MILNNYYINARYQAQRLVKKKEGIRGNIIPLKVDGFSASASKYSFFWELYHYIDIAIVLILGGEETLMQTDSDTRSHNSKLEKLERVSTILRLVNWLSLWIQLGLGVAAVLTLMFAITGRSFSQALTPTLTPGAGVVNYNQGTTPGIGIGIFWAVCGIVTLLFTIFLAFRQTRFAKRLRSPDSALHPKKADILQVLRLGIIAGLVGMLLTILGGGATLGVLLAKSVAQPQGVAIYDPNRIIRSLDIFVALANMNGITAHFVGTVASLALFNWLHNQ